MNWNTFSRGPHKGEPKTKTDRVIRFIIMGLGKTEVESKYRKYRKFTGRADNHFYFVGKNGSVRSGQTPAKSASITDKVSANMVLWEKKGNIIIADQAGMP